ncbi:uncharacterized protein GGS22DRAFT_149448 [Annulohypoxylon maeteangense]|uniref:uncharacterized protein n=1 Tax=Annulohypoxylon maeteangense TaxID=1927788 RepID=UPI002007CD82|nr:uncharacterized protein GGS22DRAFT_149448 [Annulohypoxylon maeteangense]KAI0889901.1 hypothetical protein GGS22DRAFT_149448 [Annulohypoxylon maeteangense]
MQRVSALLPWDRSRTSTGVNGSTNTSSNTNGHVRKNSVDIVRGWADKIPSPVNRLSTSRLSSRDAFLPTSLDKECEKAARIIKSFCSDGFSTPDDRPGSPSTYSSAHSSHRFLKKIPPRIIQNAVGLAVFTSMRSGIWNSGSGSGGSGVLIARKTDGTWSPPSGLMLQTSSLRFVFGVDIYDCVLVINNFTVLEAFARPRLTLGTDVSLTAGPLVALGLLENDVTWADLSDRAITYIKAKGQTAEVKLDGIIVSERADENERFYGMKISVAKILAGDINQSMPQTRSLTEVLKAAEGRTDYDTALVEQLASTPAPGDATIESPKTAGPSPAFGVPDFEDPDPFGVLALEMAGMGIREAGTRLRPDSTQFEYNPSPTSPFFPKAGRQSVDTFLSRSNRGSYMSSKTMATERSQMTDAGTQTYFATPQTTPGSSQSQSEDGNQPQTIEDILEVKEPIEVDYTKIDISALRKLSNFPDLDDEPTTTIAIKEEEEDDHNLDIEASGDKRKSVGTHTENVSANTDDEILDDTHDNDGDDEGEGEDEDGEDVEEEEEEGEEDESDDDEEEAIVYEVATAQAPARVIVGASRVNIPVRIPPPLPIRNPGRSSRTRSQIGGDVSGLVSSPLRQEFELEADVDEATTPKAKDNTDKLDDITNELSAEKVEKVEKAAIVPVEDKEDAKVIEDSVTPTRESASVEGQFAKIGDRSSFKEEVMVNVSAEAQGHSSLQTSPDRSVSVA